MEINSTSYDDWVYINLAIPAVVFPDVPEDNQGWDIACQRYHFRTNSGLSGSGFGGAYVDSSFTWTSGTYPSLTQVPDISFFEKDTVVNTFYNVVDTDGDGVEEHIFGLPGIANPSLEAWGWIDINNNYTMNYTDNQFIVRNGTGDKFYKLWSVNYYSDTGISGYIKIYFEEIMPCSMGHDDCGECGGDNSSCSGCIDDVACNYDVMASIDYGCEYPLSNYDCSGICTGIDNDIDGICDDDDLCPNTWDPYQNDRDQDGLADACNDLDDDGDGLIDCWGFWYDPEDGDVDGDGVADNFGIDCNDAALGFDEFLLLNKFSLIDLYPNPFNPSIKINLSISEYSYIDIEVYNISGQKVDVLSSGYILPGSYEFEWKPDSHISSGNYFVQVRDSKKQISKSITYLK